MAIQTTYPGVYIQEIPSGVRTIVGVSTSVTAFVGTTKRGPVNRAVRLFGYADFERQYGGLAQDSELSYAVRQFFLNGGSEALVVRVAQSPVAAHVTLQDGAPVDVLTLEAKDQGKSGNNIDVRVDYATGAPASTFNLTLTYVSPDNPSDNTTESFANLSLNSFDPRYVVDVVNDGSRLVTATREVDVSTLTDPGTSASAVFDSSVDFTTLLNSTHKMLYVAVDGAAPVALTLETAGIADIDDVSTAITAAIAALPASSRPVLTSTVVGGNQLELQSGTPGERSSVRVLPGPNDASVRLQLGTGNGGTETDGVGAIRPVESARGTLESDTVTGVTTLPTGTSNSFRISLDGAPTVTVTLPSASTVASLAAMATSIQAAVRGARPAYKDFTCVVDSGKLLLTSGGRPGAGSAVKITAAPSNDIAAALKLLPETGATTTLGDDAALTQGDEQPIGAGNEFGVYIGDRSKREGLYALDSILLFNILCLPGISEAGILAEAVAYATERRAFMIVDPESDQEPDEMLETATGTALPKSDSAAVYYPWVEIADPLRGGKLRKSAPSGTLAGLFARIDSARGVWKAPAGTEATLAGVQDLGYTLSDAQNGMLNPFGVNCLRSFPVFGIVSWGARTLRGADQMASEYKYVPIRRLALFIEQSLYFGTQWAVFEPNDDPLWAQLRLNIGAFMQNMFRQGAFQGKSPSEAYFVKCDKETTTQNDVNLGIVNIVVGFAPLKPAEFVVIKLQQIAGQIAV